MTILTISEKGQVTVPARVRRALGFKPGGSVEVEIVDDALLMRPARSIRSVRGFFAGIGVKKAGEDWDQIRRETERTVAAEVAGEGFR